MDRDQAAREHFGLGWAEVQARSRAYVEQAEAGVTRWAWVADGGLPEVPEPIALDPPRPLGAEPSAEERSEAKHVGYDAAGEILFVRYFADGAPFVEAVVVDGIVLRFLFEDDRRALQQLIHATFTDDGRLDVIREWNRGMASITWYAWDEDRPSHSVEETYERELGVPSKLINRTRTDYEHDAQGLVRVRLTIEHDRHVTDAIGATQILWVRSSPEALEAAHALVLEQLPIRIRAWATRVAPEGEPVIALALVHSFENPSLPPALALGTLDELRGLRERYGDDPNMLTWRTFSTFEFDRWDGLADELTGDRALDDAFALLDRHWEQIGAIDEPEAILRACVRKLQTLDWSEVLTPADTFIIYVMEDDVGHDLLELVEATVPRSEIEALRALP